MNADLLNVINRIREVQVRARKSHSYFVQIGAGAGDLDPRAHHRDGFTEIIKSLSLSSTDKIILVEPNPLNLERLRACWSNFSNKSIFDVGIVPKRLSGQSLNLYYTELDAPHYQVASFEPAHVLKHYPGLKISELKSLCVNTTDLNSFIAQVTNDDHIMLLSLDIEGIDAEVILDTDFKSMNVSLLSFEHLHLGSKLDECRSYVVECGFEYVGKGVDHNGYDYLYQKIT